MKKDFFLIAASFFTSLFLLFTGAANSQTTPALSVKDFAIWGGSSNPGELQTGQGVFLKGKVTINGNVGTNHLVDIMEGWIIRGNISSANIIDLKGKGQITGNLFAWKSDPNIILPAISGMQGTKFTGNISSNGKVDIKTAGGANATTISGKVSVPAPSSQNYSGPTPGGGIGISPQFPILPVMPGYTAFDNQVGTLNITKTRVVFPGVYKNLELKGGQTITFRGTGNYVFEEVKVTGNNNSFIFDLNNTTEGTINILVKKDAQFGKTYVRAVKGTLDSRVYTEVHGNGLTNGGFAFEVEARGVLPPDSYIWLGNIWAPNGGISIKGGRKQTRPHILGALWSGKRVDITENTILSYEAPSANTLTFIDPYYPPPVEGKIDEPNNIIGPELFSLAQNPDKIIEIPDNSIYKFDDAERVMIEVISKNPNDVDLKNELIGLGMVNIIDNGPHIYTITGFFPIDLLTQLNGNPRIEYVRPWYPPVTNSGQVVTQGDKTMRSNFVRQRFGLDGSGIKIGVLSDSYNSKSSAQNDVDQGDLPGTKSSGESNSNATEVQVVQDLSQRGNDEGRAMLQIVHDIAPKSTLAFRTGFLSAGDFAKGILELADPNLPGGKCDIIVDDLSYITEPFFKDGVVAQVVDQVVSQGVTYFTSAGNFGQKSYEGVFNGVSDPNVIPSPGQIHQFGNAPSEIYQSILLKPGNYTIVLQWDDEFHSLGDEEGVKTDMDLYLLGANGYRLFGFNRSNLFKDPFEVCPFIVKEETIAKLMIVRASGNANVRFKYIIFRGDATILDYNTGSSTVVGHANSNGAISVGAMLYENIPQYTPVWPGIASFSSRGGTFIREGESFITRNKPDLIGPNGVNTTVNLGGAFFNDGDNYPNFFGTSAAAPHAAAVGALIMQGRKKFNLQATVTPEEIRQQLISSAGKFSHLPGNFSFEGGFGYLQADDAMLEIANAKPIIDTLYAEVPGGENGDDPFTVVVKGRYLTNNTQIHVNDLVVPSTVSPDGTEVRATIPPIPNGEDPSFQLFNAAKSPSGEDGGFSEKKYFFSEKKTVLVRANDKYRKYGQDNPVFDVEVTIDGIPIAETDEDLTELRLDPALLAITTIATPQSKAGLYGIFVDRITPLEPGDPLNNQYNFIFENGTLNIQKMPLRITPKDQTIKYGEYLDEIEYTYETNIGGDWDFVPDTYLPEIKRLHEEYMSKNGVIVVKGYNVEDDILTEDDLKNMSTLASFQSVLKAKKYVLENGQLRALVNTIDPNDIGNQRFLIETPVNSLTNYLNNPNSTTLGYTSEEDLIHTGLLNLKALAKGDASAAMPNGQLKAMINGQLMGMVNGELETTLDPGKYAIINGNFTPVEDIVFQNGQLRALVNGEWEPATNGQLRAIVNGSYAEFNMFVENGELKAVTNGAYMNMVNGQLRAMVNGQNVSIANGQLRAMVNGQLIPLVNNELMGIANGQLRAMVNGEMAALVNGQLMALIDGAYEEVTELTLVNGQLRALINGQLRALINGQLRAMVNGEFTDIDNDQVTLVNGQLRAMVNGQLRAMVNGQLRAIVNGQLRAMVNSEAIAIEKLIQLPNGQLKALVNGNYIPIRNGQLRAMVNGQLRAMVNGELMAALINGQLTALIDGESVEITELILENGQLKAMINGQLRALINGQLRAMVNGELTDIDINGVSLVNGQLRAMVNGQLRAMVNGQLRAIVNGELMPKEDNQINFTVFENGQLKAMVNGQLRAMVNGQLRAMVNGQMQPVDSYVIENGQLKALVNGEEWVFPNGQLKALVNGQLKALVNNFDVSGTNNNAKTMVLVGEDDLDKQQGDIGGMLSMAMITGIDAGNQRIIPAAFINENYEVSYEPGYLDILQAPVTITTGNATKVFGEQNPPFTGWSVSALAYNETSGISEEDEPYCDATAESNVGIYPIEFYFNLSDNYYRIEDFGNLTILPKLLTVTADNKQVFQLPGETIPDFTISYDGLVGDDTEDSVCLSFIRPASPKVIDDYDRTVTYSNVLINGVSNVFYATPGQNLNLSGTFVSYNNPIMACPGCYTQLHIGMGDDGGNFFTNCYEATTSGSTGNLNAYFTAPSTPGIYYITQTGSWWYYCNQFPDYDHKVADNNKFAIAVVIVSATGTGSEDKITANLEPGIDLASEPGDYIISLAACSSYNPNYNVVLVNGTLSILPDPGENGLACGILSQNTIHWRGNGNFMNNNEEFGTPVGGVTANGEPKVGSGSFSFDGTGYINVGTAGSVSGEGDFSVSAWVKTTSNNPMAVINQRDEETHGEYILKIGGSHGSHTYDDAHFGQVYFMMYNPNSDADLYEVFSNTRVNDGNWHHIRGERIGTNMSIYIDGLLESSVITPVPISLYGGIKTFIGADWRDNASFFEGLIDDVKVEICVLDGGSGAEIMTEEAAVQPKAKKDIITKDLVYPNPATNTIRLQLTEDVVNINEIQVLSAFGKVNRTITRKLDDGVYEVNISGIPKGLYFLKARTPGGIKTFKFVKM